jgi:hypothetical protein
VQSVAWVDSIDECEAENSNCELDYPSYFNIHSIVPSANGQTIAVLAYSENFDGYSVNIHPLRLLDANKLADAAHGR